MSLDPNERLEALRREVEQEAPQPPPKPPEASPTAPAPVLPPAPNLTAAAPAFAPPSSTVSTRPASEDTKPGEDDGWGLDDITEVLFRGGIGTWVGIGLVAVGG